MDNVNNNLDEFITELKTNNEQAETDLEELTSKILEKIKTVLKISSPIIIDLVTNHNLTPRTIGMKPLSVIMLDKNSNQIGIEIPNSEYILNLSTNTLGEFANQYTDKTFMPYTDEGFKIALRDSSIAQYILNIADLSCVFYDVNFKKKQYNELKNLTEKIINE